MSCTAFSRTLVLPLLCIPLLCQQPGATSALDEAAADFDQGRAAEADQKLDFFLKDHPADLRALILKGAALDTLQRWRDAESYYQRALKLAPGSVQVLNNVANHYLAGGDRTRAREFYLKVLSVDRRHPNANLQLAQMCVDEKKGGEALQYLDQLPLRDRADPGTQLLRARALALDGQCAQARPLLDRVNALTRPSAGANFSTGVVFAHCKLYDQAEQAFSRALDLDPADFDVLYNLGLAALEAGHVARATKAFETALQKRPADPDCIVGLSRAYLKQDRLADSATLLKRAQRLAPGRADVPLLLAEVLARIELFTDSAEAYTRYFTLRPDDDAARRERGLALARANEYQASIRDLEWYAGKHPRDAVGFYELSLAQSLKDHGKALQTIGHALTIDPELVPARYSRALLNIAQSNPAAAVDDLRFFLERRPDDEHALSHLGSAYFSLGQFSEAADALARALKLAPNDVSVIAPYRITLLKLGRVKEAAALLSHLTPIDTPSTGVIEDLLHTAAPAHDRTVANLRKIVAANPDESSASLALARELLAQGNANEALQLLRQLSSHHSDPPILAQCGRILVEFEQYAAALEYLKPALGAEPSLSVARLDLSAALAQLKEPQAAIDELDKTPDEDRNGDYYLLRAQLLDDLGKDQESMEMVNRAMRTPATRADLYLQIAGSLLAHQHRDVALALLEQAAGALPDNRDVLLFQAVTLAVMPRDEDALKLLAQTQARWPAWDQAYLVNGIILETERRSAEARQTLETAIALGAATPQAFYYLALAITHDQPGDLGSAQKAVDRAMALASTDPYVLLLAGKISLARKQFPEAIDRLQQATRLLPALIPAHYALHDAYLAIGDKQKSAAELEAIQQIADQSPATEKNRFPAQDFFKARPPG